MRGSILALSKVYFELVRWTEQRMAYASYSGLYKA